MSVTPEIVDQFRDRMHLGDDEYPNLLRILSASNAALIKACGLYDITTDETFRELVFERSRYVYNDALEYFNDNFLSQITSLGVEKALEEIVLVVEGETDATV